MRDKIGKQLGRLYPSLKDKQITKAVERYCAAVLRELATQYQYITSDDIAAGEINFSEDAVRSKCGRIDINGKTEWLYHVMQRNVETSLVVQKYKGNNLTGRVGRVTLPVQYRDAIMNELAKERVETDPKYLDELQRKANHKSHIDMFSLDSYIKATQRAIQKGGNDTYISKLMRNLYTCLAIKERAYETDDGYMIDEYWEFIDSGRVHGYGVSLQRVEKNVRHAALGRCTKIDFMASSYAILASLAVAIDDTLDIEPIKNYIVNRSAIRKQIALEIDISEDWMKSIFTSLGFGAKLVDTPYQSIRAKIGKEKYARLVANTQFMEISKCLDQVRDTILGFDYFKQDEFELYGRTYKAVVDGEKRNNNQKMAWIYQCAESHALAAVLKTFPKDYEILLVVHDCIYIKSKLGKETAEAIRYVLKEEFPLLTFEEERVFPIHAEEDHAWEERLVAAEEAEHKYRMAVAQANAMGYNSDLVAKPEHMMNRLETELEYEQRRAREQLAEIARHTQQFEEENW